MVTSTAIAITPEIAAAQLSAKFFRGLGDPTRVRILHLLLEHGDLKIGELVEKLDAPQGRVSSHLACLKWCGFVVSYREGRNVIYTIADQRVKDLLETAERILADNAERVLACQTIARAS